jgi:hypothetical protein
VKRLLVWAGVAVVGALVALISVVSIFSHGIGRPLRWELPVGYRGWAALFFDQAQCAPLARSGLHVVIRFDGNGRACTSESQLRGWRYHRYEYVRQDGSRVVRLPITSRGDGRLIWGNAYAYPENAYEFFVGTQREYASDRTPVAERSRR